MKLEGKRIAILAANQYEDLELWYPYYRLREEGAKVKLVGAGVSEKTVLSKHGYPAAIDLQAPAARAQDFDAVIIPGGFGPDYLRRCPGVLKLVKAMDAKGKLLAAICHGPWVLVSAGVLKKKKVTSFYAIKDDVINAGAKWVDREVVVHKNLVTSRTPADLPAFMKKVIKKLAAEKD